jgi:ribosomal protein S18 acetylase RimI-like enzyme
MSIIPIVLIELSGTGPWFPCRRPVWPRKLTAMKVTVAQLGPAEFRSAIDGFVAVYAAAMKPPERMLAGRDIIMDRHAANPGFRGLAAVIIRGAHPPEPPWSDYNALAGFTYGFHGAPGQWWHDVVAGALALGPRDGRAYLDDSFEVAELHVVPSYQGMGIGRELLLQLTEGRQERTAVLSTMDTESPARRLYRTAGFTDLLTGFRFSGGEPPYAVMGARLPLRSPPSDPGDDAPDQP